MLKLLKSFNNFMLSTNLLIIILFGVGLMWAFVLKGYHLNFKRIFWAASKSKVETKDGISGWQDLMLSTVTRLGNGNIAGVASSIMAGGPGALFWMWVTAFIGMASSFAEGLLSQLYKYKKDNQYFGGPAWYIRYGAKSKTIAALAGFGVLLYSTSALGLQSNTIANNFYTVAKDVLPWSAFSVKLFAGVVLMLLVGAVVVGGIKTIGKVASALLPVMATIYMATAIFIVFSNFSKTGEVWKTIVSHAFGLKALAGGVIGYSVKKAVASGVGRASFSNTSGTGLMGYVAAASDLKHPVQGGFIQAFSTFIDTIVICSASGFLILYSGVYTTYKGSSATLIQASISSQFGNMASWVVFVSVFIFGLTTAIGLFYVIESIAHYFVSDKKWLHNATILVGSIYIVATSFAPTPVIWVVAISGVGLSAIFNTIGILPQVKTVAKVVKNYQNQIKQNPEQEPVFVADSTYNTKYWKK